MQPGRRPGHHQQPRLPRNRPDEPLATRPEIGRDKETAGRRLVGALSARAILLGTVETAELPALYALTAPTPGPARFHGPIGPDTRAALLPSRSRTAALAAPKTPSASGGFPRI